MGDARREISEIVREVATAVRSDRPKSEFYAFLCDRTLRAMAAEGVCLWQRDASGHQLRYHCVHRLGRTTDRSIDPVSVKTHDRLLVEIGSDGGPVVVPPTPGAVDADIPANPTNVPVAIAPIDCDGSLAGADYLLEVFLEPGGGVATQRGYLRFVAQMADLAGEFFRGDQLRCLRRRETLATKVDELVGCLHATNDPAKLAAAIVDGAADVFGFDRVGMLRIHGRKADLVAVSHIHSIDQRSYAADQLRRAVAESLPADGDAWNVPPIDASSETQTQSLVIRAIASGKSPDRPIDEWPYRFVAMQVAEAVPVDVDCRPAWNRFARHASLAMMNANDDHRASAFGFKFLTKKRWFAIAAMTSLVSIALIPVPLIVDVPAIVRPETSQFVSAPRDSVVDTIHVLHGQAVKQGDTLLTLTDSALQEQMTSLVGRRAVLDQQQSRLTEAMVDASSSKPNQLDQVQMQRSLVAEEVQSLEAQLAVLRSMEQSLTIRADRDGIVDAWQIDERLRSRPVRRGDGLMRVVAVASTWLVEARVPQNRIGHLAKLSSDDAPTATASLDASPSETFEVEFIQVGPAAIIDGDVAPHTSVLLRCENNDAADRSGSPARVAFHCGHRSLAYVMFQDLFHSIDRTAGLYLP